MRRSIKASGPGAPKVVPQPGSTSAIGPSGAAPAPRLKNTRDYGKKEPAPMEQSPNPFGTAGGSRLGGI